MCPDLLGRLTIPAQTKIVMLILDGLGGLPREVGGKTELESAVKPHLNELAGRSALGLTIPVAPGITPGSGPAHLALFGYDPVEHEIGRGAMEALGVDFELRSGDLAARGNFCTIDADGVVLDRRAGRIQTEKSLELIHRLQIIELDGVDYFIEPIKEHRFAFILRGAGLGAELSETDPQRIGVPPLPVQALEAGSEKSAILLNKFIESARRILRDELPANMVMLRGFAKLPQLDTFQDKYGLKAAAIAVNGMYRGVARMVGMQVLELDGQSLEDEFRALEKNWDNFDFFYLHVKKTDTCGEMGDFDGKVQAIEGVDRQLPRLLHLNPDVIIIGGDHSSPAVLKAHSWHPVPFMLFSNIIRSDGVADFGEGACSHGSLGIMPATQVMSLAMANALRLAKYGA